MARLYPSYRGLRQWHGTRWKLWELGSDLFFLEEYGKTSLKGQGISDGSLEV
jgi:hypothetical protein